jgi:pyruvate dehydrogenase (quinone)
MSHTFGDFLVERLHQWSVRHVFGYPGDGINGVFGALNRAEGRIGFVSRPDRPARFDNLCYGPWSGYPLRILATKPCSR